jgi:drug/metabolite transporter (DMT)-like permease
MAVGRARVDSSWRPTLGLLAVALAVLFWGWSNVASKTVAPSGLVVSFYRLWLALPVLWLVPLLSPAARARLDRDWLRASLVGGLLFGVHQLFFFTSLKQTSVVNVSIIGALQPALVLLVAGRMFGEPVTRAAILWSAVALAGTCLVVMGSHGSPAWSPLGDLLAALNLLSFTCYFLASKRIRAHVGPTEYVIGMTTVAAVFIAGVCLLRGEDLASPRASDWPVLIGIALVSGTLGHILTNWAHAHVSAFVVSILFLGTPVLATSGAAYWLGESLGPLQIAGGALVMSAIATIVLSAHSGAAAEELAESAAETDAP